MQFSQLLLVATAAATASAAAFGMTPSQFVDVAVGQTFNISWINAAGPVTIVLKNGEANLLETVSTITTVSTTAASGYYLWTIPSTLPVDYYALEIDDPAATTNAINYSQQFLVSGGPTTSSSASASSTSSASSASLSSSASAVSTTSGSSSTSGLTAATTSTGSMTTSTGSASRTTGSSTTGSSSRTSTSTSASSSATAKSTTSGASGVASPLALVLLAFAAIMTLN